MPKNTKSSASSATRKKQAAKAAKKAGIDTSQQKSSGPTLQRGQKKEKGKKSEPKKKVYIPPVKPKQDVTDPLDTMGLASLLPNDLVILLRKASKKDVVTRTRALEGLLEWITPTPRKPKDLNEGQHGNETGIEERQSALLIALPSWVHLFPRLATSPNRRLRQLAVQISAKLFENPDILAELVAQPAMIENILGPILVIAHSIDRLVSRMGLTLLDNITTWSESETDRIFINQYMESIVDHLSFRIFHEEQINQDESDNPKKSGTSTPVRDAKNRDEVNVEEDLEATDARLVSSALSGMAWLIQSAPSTQYLEQLLPLLNSPTIWTALSFKNSQSRSLGTLSPNVRIAGWNLIRVLVGKWLNGLDSCLSIAGPQAVHSAFIETDNLVAQSMRESLIRLLQARPEIWKMRLEDHEVDEDEHDETNEPDGQTDEDEEGEEEEEEGSAFDDNSEKGGNDDVINGQNQRYSAYDNFLELLRNGVNGIAPSYSVIILLLSTLPDEVFPPTSTKALEVTQAMYFPIDEGQLEGRELQRSFVSSFLECLVWLSGRTLAKDSIEEAVLVADAIAMLWQDYIDIGSETNTEEASVEDARSVRLNVFGEERLVSELTTCLRKLGGLNVRLANPLLKLCRDALSRSFTAPSIPIDLVCEILAKSIQTESKPSKDLVEAVYELVRDITFSTANIIASGESIDQGIIVLNQMVTQMAMAQDDDSMSALRLAFERLLDRPATTSSDQLAIFLTSYVLLLRDDHERKKSWSALLDAIVQPSGDVNWSLLRAVSRATNGKERALALQDSFSEKLDAAFLVRYRENIVVSGRLLARPEGILGKDTPRKILGQIAGKTSQSEMILLEEWLKADKTHVRAVFEAPDMRGIIAPIFQLAILNGDRQASGIWRLFSLYDEAYEIAQEVLKSQLISVEWNIQSIMNAVRFLGGKISLNEIIPKPDIIRKDLEKSFGVSISSALCTNDALVPVREQEASDSGFTIQYDSEGYSPLARISIAILASIEDDPITRKSASLLPVLINFAIGAEDACLERSKGGGHTLFAKTVDPITLQQYLNRAISYSTSILSAKASGLGQEWFNSLTKVLQGQAMAQDEMQIMINDLWNQTTIGSLRVLERVLKGVLNFSGAGQTEAETLLRFAQSAERSQPDRVRAVFLASNSLILDSPLYERLRNQTASELAGIKPVDVSTKGVSLLNTLVALVPPIDSFTSLIPQQRTIFLMQTIQTWVASDEDLPVTVLIRLAQIFVHILPIVQEIPGNHLDLIIDIIEINLGETDFKTEAGLPKLYFTLLLLDAVIEIAARSATFRDVWKDRKSDVFEAFRECFLAFADKKEVEAVQGKVGETVLLQSNLISHLEERFIDIVRTLPASLFKSDTAKLAVLLHSSSSDLLAITAYRLLAHNIREYVKELVVEAAVSKKVISAKDTEVEKEEDKVDDDNEKRGVSIENKPETLRISSILTGILQQPQQHSALAYLLAWLATFEYFEESSLEIRAAYTSQLHSMKLIDDCLIPFVLTKVSPTNDQNRWVLDEVFLDHIQSENTYSIEVLSVHVFYRALIHTPNLIRDSYFSIKDKQQSNAIHSLTVRHLTPLLSQREFGHLRQADVLERLQDENMQIKVLGNSSEVIATYTVDEYPLEIAITMPNDYPLRPVEVRDIRKIGISEGTWRAWILGMRQLIAGRNGLIFDALLLFKRNVEAKFSGFDEDSTCAICYSIVSPNDHSLPKKPCKTCKKKFHSSCLFKWVSTSGSSTCPLCRSIL